MNKHVITVGELFQNPHVITCMILRKVQQGLNKGKAINSVARAIFF
jgi:hypothetical protein